MGIYWTCCVCEQQVEDHQYDSDERMCECCLSQQELDDFEFDFKKNEERKRKKVDNEKFWRDEVYLYLEQLRESGETNMFGAGVYLQKHFELSKEKAIMYLSDWMKQYNQGGEQ